MTYFFADPLITNQGKFLHFVFNSYKVDVVKLILSFMLLAYLLNTHLK